jgi:hypothetical protein
MPAKAEHLDVDCPVHVSGPGDSDFYLGTRPGDDRSVTRTAEVDRPPFSVPQLL